MVVQTLVLGSMLLCAIQAIRSPRLLVSALWLAGCSALLGLTLALLGAPEVGVIELSVGAGLVTVIFVFAISIAGEEPAMLKSVVPRPLAGVLIGVFFILLLILTVPRLLAPALTPNAISAVQAIWEVRALDTLLQCVLIFCGVLGSLGLLAEPRAAARAQGGAQ